MQKLVPMPYYKMYQVPLWFVVGKHENTPKVLKWFETTNARSIEWPAETFFDTIEGMKKKGWSSTFARVGDISAQGLALAFANHCKENMNPFVANVPLEGYISQMNRRLQTREDYAKFFNLILDTIPPVELAQMFMVQEHCFGQNQEKAWYSSDNFDYTTIKKLAKKVVIIDAPVEGFTPDIDITTMDKFVSKKLSAEMSKILESLS